VYHNKRNLQSNNKCKAILDITKELSSKQHSKIDIQALIIDSKYLRNKQDIAYAFNNYFSSKIDKINKNNVDNKKNNENISTFHFYLEQN